MRIYKKSFFTIGICALFLVSVDRIAATSDGKLHLKTDVITSDQTGIGGKGDFSIRSQLFLQDLEVSAQDQEQAKARLLDEAEGINFQTLPTTEKKSGFPDTHGLFVNYQPQHVAFVDEEDNLDDNRALGIIIGFLIAAVIGLFLGKWWSKRRRRNR